MVYYPVNCVTMYTFDEEFTATVTDLKTKRFTNLGRQKQLSEKIWHLEDSIIEQRVEETEVRECLRKNQVRVERVKGSTENSVTID